MAVASAAFQKFLAFDTNTFRVIENARLAFAGDAIALDITQMRLGRRQAFAGELDDARLGDDAAAAERRSNGHARPAPGRCPRPVPSYCHGI